MLFNAPKVGGALANSNNSSKKNLRTLSKNKLSQVLHEEENKDARNADANTLDLIKRNFPKNYHSCKPSFNSSSLIPKINKVIITNKDMLVGDCMNGHSHPSRKLSRHATNDFERQNVNVRAELGEDIDGYLRKYQQEFDITNCLERHKITPALRARMIDWMIEVLTNFKCDDQTFFIAVSLQDRYFKGCTGPQEVSDLHLTGVTAMFIASKFEDIYPLKMKTVFEKIAH